MADPQYQVDARRIGLKVNPLDGRAMQNLMKMINDMPEDLVAQLRALIVA